MNTPEKVIVPKLAKIASELHDIFKRGTADVIQIGRLLRSAKKAAGHGEFLPWLDREFSLSEKSAQRYMAAHQFMTEVVTPLLKSDKLSDLRLRPSALYELVEMHSRGVVTEADVEVILRAAAQNWIGKKRLLEIYNSRHPVEAPGDSEKAGETEVAAKTDTEIAGETARGDADDSATSTKDADEAIDEAAKGKDEQSSEKPPATAPKPKSAPSARDEGNLLAFAANTLNLKRLATGPAKKYAATAVQIADLETVAEFLRAVADLKKKQGAAAGISAEATAETCKAQYAEAA